MTIRTLDLHNTLATLLAISILTCGITREAVAQDRVYDDATVWDVSYVKTEPGQFDAYLGNLNQNWKRMMDAAKAEGHILSYMILSSEPSSRDDWDLMLLVEYPNMAALDNSREVFERNAREVLQTNREQQSRATVERRKLRELLGGKLARQLVFKQ